MAPNKSVNPRKDALRRAAEDRLARGSPPITGTSRTPAALIHELQVHQIELELQNEELRRARDESEEARNRYVELYDFAPVGYLTVDHQGEIVEVNLTAAALLGLDRADLLAQSFRLRVDPKDQDRWMGHLEHVLRGTPQTCELLIRPAGGGCFPALLTCIPSAHGPSTRARCTLVDISARVRLEEERRIAGLLEVNDRLRRAQFKLAQAVRVARLGIWEWEPATDKAVWNEEMFEIYGVRPEEFTGRGSDYFAFAREDYRRAQQSRIQAAVAAGATEGAALSNATPWPAAQELCILRPDGSQRFTLGNEIALSTGKLEALRVLGVSIDITELRSAQVALAESEAKFRRLAEDAVLGIYIIQEGKLAYVNPSLARTFGYLPDEIAGKMVPQDLIHPADVELLLRRLAERLDGVQAGQSSTYRGVRKDGSEIELEVWGVSVEYHGKPAVQGTLIDVTARRTLERQLLQAQRMESVGRLAGGVAHDFNNMLCVISMGAQAALEKLGPSHPVQVDLEEILAAARRSTDLTRQLLAFARIQPVAPRVLDLNETVSGMLRMLRRLVGENLSLAWQPGATLWSVYLDPSQVDQILANLCINARDAIPDVGTITIATWNRTFESVPGQLAGGDYVCLKVTDTGLGMDEATRSHAFDPFFTTKEVGKGTGLGLATVYGIVQQNSGCIDLQSAPGEGTSVTIYLPKRSGEAVDPHARREDGQEQRGNETLVIVDDEPALLRVNKRVLVSLGYTVLAAGTPGEAIRLAREHEGEIHLLVTDLLMPQQNGRHLAKDFLSLRPQARCLFMSGYAADIIPPDGTQAKEAFLQKPFTAGALASKVRRVLDGPH